MKMEIHNQMKSLFLLILEGSSANRSSNSKLKTKEILDHKVEGPAYHVELTYLEAVGTVVNKANHIPSCLTETVNTLPISQVVNPMEKS